MTLRYVCPTDGRELFLGDFPHWDSVTLHCADCGTIWTSNELVETRTLGDVLDGR